MDITSEPCIWDFVEMVSGKAYSQDSEWWESKTGLKCDCDSAKSSKLERHYTYIIEPGACGSDMTRGPLLCDHYSM